MEADILISSTGAKEFVITKEMMTFVDKMRKGRPLFMVDIAVPRDFDPAIGEFENVFLYDIDDLEGIVEANMQERKKQPRNIQFMIETEIVEFNQWLNILVLYRLFQHLREKALCDSS